MTTTVSFLTFGDLATVGPGLTPPRSGEYYVEFGNQGEPTAANGAAYTNISIDGGANLIDGNANHMIVYAANTADIRASVQRTRKATLTSGTAVRMKYNTNNNTQAFWENRWLRIVPLRVN